MFRNLIFVKSFKNWRREICLSLHGTNKWTEKMCISYICFPSLIWTEIFVFTCAEFVLLFVMSCYVIINGQREERKVTSDLLTAIVVHSFGLIYHESKSRAPQCLVFLLEVQMFIEATVFWPSTSFRSTPWSGLSTTKVFKLELSERIIYNFVICQAA